MLTKTISPMELFSIISKNRISIKRAIARFFYVKKINIAKEDFDKIVRRTQDNGYKSGVNTLCTLFLSNGYTKKQIKNLLYSFTIEYNVEMIYCRMFPKGNENMQNIMSEGRNIEDKAFFDNVLYEIVKANSLQREIINLFV